MTLNFCFIGNPGTGKTTVARLFAQILLDAGLRSINSFTEKSAQQLKEDGSDKFRDLLAQGGTVFIDEAYDLDPIADIKGKSIMNQLLTSSENNRDKLSIILAGYQDEIYSKIYSYNEGNLFIFFSFFFFFFF